MVIEVQQEQGLYISTGPNFVDVNPYDLGCDYSRGFATAMVSHQRTVRKAVVRRRRRIDPYFLLTGMAEGSPSASPSSSASDGGASGTQSPPPCKTTKVCGVCGDRAKSFHFGGLSCDSCKAFFRRSVQNDAHVHFHCPYSGRCAISLASRKCCQFCRFQKCLAIGMETGWVMTDDERLHLQRLRLDRKARLTEQSQQQRQQGQPSIDDAASSASSSSSGSPLPALRLTSLEHEPELEVRCQWLREDDIYRIDEIIKSHRASVRHFPFSHVVLDSALDHDTFTTARPQKSSVDVVSMFAVCIRRFTHFAQQLDTFRALSTSDQAVLLRSAMVEMCAIRGVRAVDGPSCQWPPPPECDEDAPWMCCEDMSRLVSGEAFERHSQLVQSLRDLRPDEVTLLLLILTVLFCPERSGLEQARHVETAQEEYLRLLRAYMQWRCGPAMAARLYPKMLLKLPDLRELSDAHARCVLRLGREELAEIQGQIGHLRLIDDTVLHEPSMSNNGSSGLMGEKNSTQPTSPEFFPYTHDWRRPES